MSVEFQEAFLKDQSVINTDGSYDYVDNKEVNIEPVADIQNDEVEEIQPKQEPKKVSLDEL